MHCEVVTKSKVGHGKDFVQTDVRTHCKGTFRRGMEDWRRKIRKWNTVMVDTKNY